METISLEKVSVNFKPIGDFLKVQTHKKKGCWASCGSCKNKWKDIDTEFVSMSITKKGTTVFICDPCIKKAKNVQEVTIEVTCR